MDKVRIWLRCDYVQSEDNVPVIGWFVRVVRGRTMQIFELPDPMAFALSPTAHAHCATAHGEWFDVLTIGEKSLTVAGMQISAEEKMDDTNDEG